MKETEWTVYMTYTERINPLYEGLDGGLVFTIH